MYLFLFNNLVITNNVQFHVRATTESWLISSSQKKLIGYFDDAFALTGLSRLKPMVMLFSMCSSPNRETTVKSFSGRNMVNYRCRFLERPPAKLVYSYSFVRSVNQFIRYLEGNSQHITQDGFASIKSVWAPAENSTPWDYRHVIRNFGVSQGSGCECPGWGARLLQHLRINIHISPFVFHRRLNVRVYTRSHVRISASAMISSLKSVCSYTWCCFACNTSLISSGIFSSSGAMKWKQGWSGAWPSSSSARVRPYFRSQSRCSDSRAFPVFCKWNTGRAWFAKDAGWHRRPRWQWGWETPPGIACRPFEWYLAWRDIGIIAHHHNGVFQCFSFWRTGCFGVTEPDNS